MNEKFQKTKNKGKLPGACAGATCKHVINERTKFGGSCITFMVWLKPEEDGDNDGGVKNGEDSLNECT